MRAIEQLSFLRDGNDSSRSISPLLLLTLIFILAPTILADGKRSDDGDRSSGEERPVKVEVNNFGKVADFFYRGAQPKEDEYAQLQQLGIKTIIDLRHDPKGYAREAATEAGMKYVNFPMSDHDYPAPDTAEKFLKLISDESLWPVYVHCAGGRHRTGVMAAVYRMTVEGWDIDRAYREMKQYDFYTRWGHKVMKTYVYDYYKSLQEKASQRPATQSAAAQPGAQANTSTPVSSIDVLNKFH